MKTLKGIALLFAFCAIGAGMFFFVVFGMLFLALRDGFFAVVGAIARRVRGESKRSNQPKVLYGGRDGVPNLVVDGDGFVEPPLGHTLPLKARTGVAIGHLIPDGHQLLDYNTGASWGNGPAVGVLGEDGRMKILQFPVTAAERQRLIDSRPKQPDHDGLGCDIVFIHGQAGRKS